MIWGGEKRSAPDDFAAILYEIISLFVWLVTDGWWWFVLREKYYCWLMVAGLF
jgi:hypothetical protein